MWALICILHKSLDLNYLSPLLKNWISIVNVLPAIHLPALEQALYTPCSTSNTLTCSRTRSVHSMFFQEYTYLLQTQICTLLVLPGIHSSVLELDPYIPCSTRNTLTCSRTKKAKAMRKSSALLTCSLAIGNLIQTPKQSIELRSFAMRMCINTSALHFFYKEVPAHSCL